MNSHDIQNAILLRESGELSPEEAARLDQALEQHPEQRRFAEESAVLQHAGRFSTETLTPPASDLQRERLLSRAKAPTSRLPKLLALAALLVIGLGLWPHFSQRFQSDPPRITADVSPVREDLTEADPLLEELEVLDTQITRMAEMSIEQEVNFEDADYWAEQLLAMEDSI